MYKRFLLMLALCLAAAPTFAQKSDLTIGEINFPSLRWGTQTAQFSITNNTDGLKFAAVVTEIKFEGGYLNPDRRARSNYLITPGETIQAKAKMLIPGNYGKALATVKVYDVVDTLDELLPGQGVFKQPFDLTFHVPDGMAPYLQERINLPPRVEDHPYFDNDLSRVLFLLLSKGMTPGHIADLAMCDTSFVESQIATMKEEGYVRKDDSGKWALTVPFIGVDEAAAAKVISNSVADSLTTLIAARMPAFHAVVDSLIKAGAVPTDPKTFYNGGTVLYHPFPVIGGLAIWWTLGTSFITRSAPFLLLDGTDICNADIPQYMYAAQGGPDLNGHQFYVYEQDPTGDKIMFGAEVPKLICPADFMMYKKYPQAMHWSFDPDHPPRNFMLDTAIVRTALRSVTHGTQPLLAATYNSLKALAIKNGHPKLDYGYRFWFWNLTASRILDNLVSEKVLAVEGNGQYQFNQMKGGPR